MFAEEKPQYGPTQAIDRYRTQIKDNEDGLEAQGTDEVRLPKENKLMIYYDEECKPYLKVRESPFLFTDCDDQWKMKQGLYSEVNFTNVS